jgi:hypothetical protein
MYCISTQHNDSRSVADDPDEGELAVEKINDDEQLWKK